MASFDNILVIVFFVLSAIFLQQDAAYFDFSMEEKVDVDQIMKILMKPRQLDRKRPAATDRGNSTELRVNGFSWKNCGSSSDPLRLLSLSVSPDPIKIPGSLKLQFTADLKENIGSPLQAKVEVKKKIGFWIPVPCIDDIGSCTYDNICTWVPLKPEQPCPDPLAKYKIPCRCPLKAGNYSLPLSSFKIPTKLPGVLADGDYQVTVDLSFKGHRVGCYEVTASLSA